LPDIQLNWENRRSGVTRTNLPFQDVEIINQPREKQTTLLPYKESSTTKTTNRLIWGDNKWIMSSLMAEFAGNIDLIYIDPPFATGADFTVPIKIAEQRFEKSPSIIEEFVYRDTWGHGIASYLQMMYDRLVLMKDLLSNQGSIYVHLDSHVGHYVKIILDEIFGKENFRNEIIWQRIFAHNDPKRYGIIHDNILFYTKSENWKWTYPKVEYEEWYKERYYRYKDPDGRRWLSRSLTGAGAQGGQYEWRGRKPPGGRHWSVKKEAMDDLLNQGKIFFTKNGIPRFKQYLDEMEGQPLQTLWNDILPIVSWSSEEVAYPTQKPEALLDRIIEASSEEGDLVADFFCGSGTTLASAERLHRRWIGADLSKYAIHATRKRLLGIPTCSPFIIQNLGNYEKHKFIENGRFPPVEKYIEFILQLYRAKPITGYSFLHGTKNSSFVHISSVDGPLTESEVMDALFECTNVASGAGLDLLCWDFEMGLDEVVRSIQEDKKVNIRLKQIPREALEIKDPAESSSIKFFDKNSCEVSYKVKGNDVEVTLENFALANMEFVPEEIRPKIYKFTDYIDYWAIDFNYANDVFHNQWQSFKTPGNPTLELTAEYTFNKAGKHLVLTKLIDIFGNDTNKLLQVTTD
jgi:adenine-specific DNA-methyltransferase